MMEIVVADIGGTHARFALAEVDAGGVTLGPETVLRTSDFEGYPDALDAFAAMLGRPLPNEAGIAVAAPVDATTIRLTNNDWIIQRDELGVHSLVNDFAAVAYAVSICPDSAFLPVCGPDEPLPRAGVISVVGPGTGLGVAILHRNGADQVVPTEGGHVEFAAVDETDDRILHALRRRHGRVSVERVVCGSGLATIHATLTGEEMPDKMLWQQALSGDEATAASLARFCMILGSVAGDMALAQGASAVVIAGGLGLRLAQHLPQSGFRERFVAKGRYSARMAALPVKLITHPQPGLLGAAAAFRAEHLAR